MRWIMAGAVFTLFGITVAFHLAAMGGNYNDKACHRAMVYFCEFSETAVGKPVVAAIRSSWRSADPYERLTYCSSYPLPGALTLWLDKLPLSTAFQSVFFAHLFLHLLALALSLASWRALGGPAAGALILGALLSVTPWCTQANWAFPFSNDFFGVHSWMTTYPRGGSVLLLTTAYFIAFVAAARRSQRRRGHLFGLALLLFVLAVLMHIEMAVMNAVVAVSALLLPRVVGVREPFADSESCQRALWRSAALAASLATAKLAVLLAYFVGVRGIPAIDVWRGTGTILFASIATVIAVPYFLGTAWLIRWWAQVRTRTLAGDSLVSLGDGVALLLLASSIVAVGLYPFSPTSHEWTGSVSVLLYEPGRRMLAQSQLAWFLLLGVAASVRFSERQHIAAAAALALVVFVCVNGVSIAYQAFRSGWQEVVTDTSLLETGITDVAGRPMRTLQDYEVYHAIANDFRRSRSKEPGRSADGN